MKSGVQILWSIITICKMSKTSWQTGKLFEALVGISPKSERDKARIHQFGKKVSRLRFDRGENLERGHSDSVKTWMHQKFISEDWMQKKSPRYEKPESLRKAAATTAAILRQYIWRQNPSMWRKRSLKRTEFGLQFLNVRIAKGFI